MHTEILFCDDCHAHFEADADMAATIQRMQADYECYGDVRVQCNACTVKAMRAEQEREAELERYEETEDDNRDTA